VALVALVAVEQVQMVLVVALLQLQTLAAGVVVRMVQALPLLVQQAAQAS
jgi:hypothetical protein